MNEKQENHIIDILFVIALFCIFALSAIFLISIGANVYGKTVEHMDSNFSQRTSFAYVTEKIRQSDQLGAVSAGELDGHPALLIAQNIGGSEYITYLYEYDGYLKELMVRADTPLGPEAGQDILAITDFSLTEIHEGFFSFTITTDNGTSCSLYVSTKSAGGDSHEE